MLGWLFDFSYGQDARVYGPPYQNSVTGEPNQECLGWFFWNGKREIHERRNLPELRDMGFTVDEIRQLVFTMPRITYCNTRN